MSLLKDNINWTGSELSKVRTMQCISVSKEEARKRAVKLQRGIISFIAESDELYKVSPTTELGGVILMAENISRELEKLK